MDSDINPNNMSSFAVMNDGRIIAVLNQWDDETQTSINELVLMERVDASSLPEKTVLTLACFYLDYNIQQKIVDFNKTSDAYRIVVKDYSEFNTNDDYSAGLTKLNTEIMSGVIPDMFLTENLPIERYAAKGILTDLYELIDSDSELTRESFVPRSSRPARRTASSTSCPRASWSRPRSAFRRSWTAMTSGTSRPCRTR